ncbi:hypothetical protein FRC15_006971, partial [Serendipita sp. 397]
MPVLITSFGIIAGAAILSAIAAPLTIATVGFSTGGVVAGSAAAGIHAGIGNVAAGSLFALFQSLGTMPLFTALIGA